MLRREGACGHNGDASLWQRGKDDAAAILAHHGGIIGQPLHPELGEALKLAGDRAWQHGKELAAWALAAELHVCRAAGLSCSKIKKHLGRAQFPQAVYTRYHSEELFFWATLQRTLHQLDVLPLATRAQH